MTCSCKSPWTHLMMFSVAAVILAVDFCHYYMILVLAPPILICLDIKFTTFMVQLLYNPYKLLNYLQLMMIFFLF